LLNGNIDEKNSSMGMFKKSKIGVPQVPDIKNFLLRNCHDNPCARKLV
jgi:hypothetical protein